MDFALSTMEKVIAFQQWNLPLSSNRILNAHLLYPLMVPLAFYDTF